MVLIIYKKKKKKIMACTGKDFACYFFIMDLIKMVTKQP
jgi:hypothetical protein